MIISALVCCAEWWAFEVVALFVGMLGSVQLSAFICVTNLGGITFQFSAACGATAATLVGNALGAADHEVC
jgi:MATE family multidrug resistance protein